MAFDRIRGQKPQLEVKLVLAAEQTVDGPAALFELWRAGDSEPLNRAPLGEGQGLDELIPDGLSRSEAKAARRALVGTRVSRISAGDVALSFGDQEKGGLRLGETLSFSSGPELASLETPSPARATSVAGPTLGL